KIESTTGLDRQPLTNQYQSLSNQLATKTPLKQNPPISSSRPVPSVSHKNLFQTPQNKTSGDYVNSSHIQTPATIFSHWTQNNMMSTPLQNRMLGSDSSVKGARRPLAETSESRASVKNLPSHGKTLEINENQSPEPIPDHYNTEKKNTTGEYVSKNYPICNLSKHNEYEIDKHRGELKNKPTTHISDTYSTEKRHTMGDHMPNTYKVNHQSRRTDYELEKHPSESKGILTKPLSERHASNRPTVTHESVAARENINKNSTVDNVKIQASVPSSTKKSQHGKTITVKNKEYMILGFLGQGMSGNVYRVQDLKTFELRAIKVVDLSRMDKENMQSSIQEINMLCKLQAPCIVQMFDYEIIGQTIYVVLEMGDTDLSKFIKTICAEKKLPVTMILYYWTEIKYKISYKSDVWSLGCILYSLVFGYTPFQHIRQNWAKIGAITNPSTKISFDLPPNSQPIPSILIDVIKRCLNYNPKERPSVCDLINIQYISITSNNTNISKPNIPHNTLVKIKQALDENEWRQFIEVNKR
ncbi:GSCOCG00007648001-RA-CDS, partial [Cotesia congregata]